MGRDVPLRARARTACALTPRWSTTLPPTSTAPERARVLVDEHLCADHGSLARAAVGLLVAELVSYLAVSGTRWVTLTLDCEVTHVRVSVAVARSGPALRRAALSSDVSIRLVEKVARRWGRHRDSDGESVWCTVPTGVLPSRDAVRRPAEPDQASAGWLASQPA